MRLLQIFPSFLITLILWFSLSKANAQPNVNLTVEQQNNYRHVLFTFTQDDLPSMAGCHYNLLAAAKAKHLETLPGKGLSIATFFREQAVVQIIAGPLPRLAQNFGVSSPRFRTHVKLYFRVLLSCPEGTDGYGELVSLRIATSPNGTFNSINALRRRMKYRMQYYEP